MTISKLQRPNILLMLLTTLLTGPLKAAEQPGFVPIDTIGDLEVRKYQARVVARTLITSTFTDAGDQGFRRLADYIFGGNDGARKIAMTAPVSVTGQSEQSEVQQYWVTFYMPSEYLLQDLPAPDDPRVELVVVPENYMAVLKYRGNWSEDRYREHEARLLAQLSQSRDWTKQGEPSWARYNPPFMPSFMRTNEVAIEVVPRYPENIE
jgi:hypothetical protein